jgi:hypothetical protein
VIKPAEVSENELADLKAAVLVGVGSLQLRGYPAQQFVGRLLIGVL